MSFLNCGIRFLSGSSFKDLNDSNLLIAKNKAEVQGIKIKREA